MERRCIALIDWNWSGHHPNFFNQFILALEELGLDVFALCPDPVGAAELAASTRSHCEGGNRGRTQFMRLEPPAARFAWLRPRRIGIADQSIRRFTGIERQIIQWQKTSGRSVHGVFYACIYDWEFEWFSVARHLLRFPWTGLYLQALSYRMPGRIRPGSRKPPCPEKIFRSGLCMGVGILDEGIVSQVADHLQKPVVVIPDLADERRATTDEDRKLGEQLKNFAAGRPIIGLFGHLQVSKGLLTFLKAARLAEATGICFALGGEIFWPYHEKEIQEIRDALEGIPNLWCHLSRIPTEPALNHLICVCDVVAASYIDFPHSSGIQAKAAALDRPLIVSDGYLMAERVRRFRTGEVVAQEDEQALLEATLKIIRNPDAWRQEMSPQWREYQAEHSFERLKDKLAELIFLKPDSSVSAFRSIAADSDF